MNEHFVSVKVDREERPDVDAVYMEATQAMTGHGGWPMTVLPDPERRAVLLRHVLPAEPTGTACRRSAQVLPSVARRVDASGATRSTTPARGRRPRSWPSAPRHRPAPTTGRRRRSSTRRRPCAARRVRRRRAAGSAARRSSRRRWCWSSCCATTRAPATDGALRDGRGAPARRWRAAACTTSSPAASRATPSTPRWVVPHFEKMLYDNALLLRVYVHWWRATGTALARRVAVETCDWLLRELRTAEGGFAVGARRRHRGRRGQLPTSGRPASSSRCSGRTTARGRPSCSASPRRARSSTARRVLQLLRDPDDADRCAVACASRLLRGRAGRASAAGTRRQGGRGLERAGHRRARRGRRAARPAGPGRGRDGGAPTCSLDAAPRSTAGCAGCSRDGVVGAPAGVLEDYADVAEGLLALHRSPASAVARRAPATCSTRCSTHFARRRRRLLRHRRRRRARWSAGRRTRPTTRPRPGQSRRRRRAADLRRADRLRRHRAAAEAALGDGRAADRRRHPRFAGWAAARSPRRCWPARARSRSSDARPGRCCTGRAAGDRAGRGRRSTGRQRPAARRPALSRAPRRTSAGASSATPRPPTPAALAARLRSASLSPRTVAGLCIAVIV